MRVSNRLCLIFMGFWMIGVFVLSSSRADDLVGCKSVKGVVKQIHGNEIILVNSDATYPQISGYELERDETRFKITEQTQFENAKSLTDFNPGDKGRIQFTEKGGDNLIASVNRIEPFESMNISPSQKYQKPSDTTRYSY